MWNLVQRPAVARKWEWENPPDSDRQTYGDPLVICCDGIFWYWGWKGAPFGNNARYLKKINIREDKLLLYHCLLELGTQKVNVSEHCSLRFNLWLFFEKIRRSQIFFYSSSNLYSVCHNKFWRCTCYLLTIYCSGYEKERQREERERIHYRDVNCTEDQKIPAIVPNQAHRRPRNLTRNK
jgi:hypothetical protein